MSETANTNKNAGAPLTRRQFALRGGGVAIGGLGALTIETASAAETTTSKSIDPMSLVLAT